MDIQVKLWYIFEFNSKHLLKLMLHRDPSCRIDSINALNHIYFTEPRESPTLKEDKGNIYVY